MISKPVAAKTFCLMSRINGLSGESVEVRRQPTSTSHCRFPGCGKKTISAKTDDAIARMGFYTRNCTPSDDSRITESSLRVVDLSNGADAGSGVMGIAFVVDRGVEGVEGTSPSQQR